MIFPHVMFINAMAIVLIKEAKVIIVLIKEQKAVFPFSYPFMFELICLCLNAQDAKTGKRTGCSYTS